MKERIQTLRKKKNLTLQQLADNVNSSKSYMWELETKDKPNTSAVLLLGISKSLDTTIEYLVSGVAYEADDELRLLRGYRLLTKNERNSLHKIIQSFLQPIN
jgi:transcriptional regulator with XRE-family HTH domain